MKMSYYDKSWKYTFTIIWTMYGKIYTYFNYTKTNSSKKQLPIFRQFAFS